MTMRVEPPDALTAMRQNDADFAPAAPCRYVAASEHDATVTRIL